MPDIMDKIDILRRSLSITNSDSFTLFADAITKKTESMITKCLNDCESCEVSKSSFYAGKIAGIRYVIGIKKEMEKELLSLLEAIDRSKKAETAQKERDEFYKEA